MIKSKILKTLLISKSWGYYVPLFLKLFVMKTDELNKIDKSVSEASKNASESLNWLLNANPNIKNLIEKFDLEVTVKPKSKRIKNSFESLTI